MFELLFAVVLVAGLGALFGGLKGARTAILLVGTLGVLSVAVIVGWGLYADNRAECLPRIRFGLV